MKTFFALALLIAFVACNNSDFDMTATAEKLEKLESELESNYDKNEQILVNLFEHIEHLKQHSTEAKNRKRRAICGRKLTVMAIQVCGSLDRSPSTNIDLSPVCCTTKSCDDTFIKTAMCPDLLKA